jgi:hypothetical protein
MSKTSGQASDTGDIGTSSMIARLRRLVIAGIKSGFEPHNGMDEIKAEGRRRLARRAG